MGLFVSPMPYKHPEKFNTPCILSEHTIVILLLLLLFLRKTIGGTKTNSCSPAGSRFTLFILFIDYYARFNASNFAEYFLCREKQISLCIVRYKGLLPTIRYFAHILKLNRSAFHFFHCYSQCFCHTFTVCRIRLTAIPYMPYLNKLLCSSDLGSGISK